MAGLVYVCESSVATVSTGSLSSPKFQRRFTVPTAPVIDAILKVRGCPTTAGAVGAMLSSKAALGRAAVTPTRTMPAARNENFMRASQRDDGFDPAAARYRERAHPK